MSVALQISIHCDERWQPLATIAERAVILEDSLPIRIRISGRTVAQALKAIGSFEPDRRGSMASGDMVYWWNPFADSATERYREYMSRISYGNIDLRLQIDGEEIVIPVSIVPSKLTSQQASNMRKLVAGVADELLQTWYGRTHSEVELLSAPPRDAANTLAQIERYVSPALPALRRIGRSPKAKLVPTRRARRPSSRTSFSPCLDIYENRFVVFAVHHWMRLLRHCAYLARLEATARETMLDRYRPPNKDIMPPAWLDARDDEARRYRTHENEALKLSARLQKSLGKLAELRVGHLIPQLTPPMHRLSEYHCVFQAWTNVRRECYVVVGDRHATRHDLPVSLLYEHWVFFAFTRLLLSLGWTPKNDPWRSNISWHRFEVGVRQGAPWRFARDDETLDIVFQPTLQWIRGREGTGSPRQRAIQHLVTRRDVLSRAYTTERQVTPDYLILWRDSSGSGSLVVADAKFMRVRTSDSTLPQNLHNKIEKVKNRYARATWVVLPDGATVEAVQHLGTVFYPGTTGTATAWNSSVIDARLFPLCPGHDNDNNSIHEYERARANLKSLLADMRTHKQQLHSGRLSTLDEITRFGLPIKGTIR